MILRMKESNLQRLRIVAVLLAGIFCSHSMAQTMIEEFVPGSTVEGVNYFLPKTALRVVVTAEKEVVIPGEYNMYAYKYMRMQDVPLQTSVTWRLKDIMLQPYGVPDKSKAYSLKLKGQTVAPLVSLSSDGLLLAINTTAGEEVLPPLPKGKNAQATVTKGELHNYLTREMLQAGSQAKTAELIAQEIYTVRESRDALLRGEADNTPKDGQQLKLMLDGLEHQQQVLTSVFAGTKEVSEVVYVFDIIPAKETDKLLLCRFSKRLGLVDHDDMAGAPVYISIKCMEMLPQVVQDEKAEAKKAKFQSGVYCNVPVRTELKIYDVEDTYVCMEIPMAQFGRVELLSGELFNKMSDTQVTFFQSTGGVKELRADESKEKKRRSLF